MFDGERSASSAWFQPVGFLGGPLLEVAVVALDERAHAARGDVVLVDRERAALAGRSIAITVVQQLSCFAPAAPVSPAPHVSPPKWPVQLLNSTHFFVVGARVATRSRACAAHALPTAHFGRLRAAAVDVGLVAVLHAVVGRRRGALPARADAARRSRRRPRTPCRRRTSAPLEPPQSTSVSSPSFCPSWGSADRVEAVHLPALH